MWADLLSQASANARPLSRYLVFMATAGIIAAFSVIYEETTLLVGAMAISPDALPITAAATALVVRRWRLSGRAVVTLASGLGVALPRRSGDDVRAQRSQPASERLRGWSRWISV